MIIIYKTTCLINNKIYIGQHKIRYPSTLDPWYLGSGKAFQAALKKYGVENFKREILAICSSQKQANIFERKAILELKPEYNIQYFRLILIVIFHSWFRILKISLINNIILT